MSTNEPRLTQKIARETIGQKEIMMIGLTRKAEARMEEQFKLKQRAVELLGVIVAEWQSDPTSVQCFDLRLVKEAIEISKRLKQLDVLASRI